MPLSAQNRISYERPAKKLTVLALEEKHFYRVVSDMYRKSRHTDAAIVGFMILKYVIPLPMILFLPYQTQMYMLPLST